MPVHFFGWAVPSKNSPVSVFPRCGSFLDWRALAEIQSLSSHIQQQKLCMDYSLARKFSSKSTDQPFSFTLVNNGKSNRSGSSKWQAQRLKNFYAHLSISFTLMVMHIMSHLHVNPSGPSALLIMVFRFIN
jgi:hypothetical protein